MTCSMRTRLVPIIVVPIAVAVIILLILVTSHISASKISARPLLQQLDRYYKDNSTIFIGRGKTVIRLLSETKLARGINLEKIYLNNVTIGHASSKNFKIFFIEGLRLEAIYLSSSLALTEINLRNFTYIFYVDRKLGKAYECFKGILTLKIGSSRYSIETSGICFLYNLSETPYDLSKIYYNKLLSILRKFNCRRENGNVTCILRTDVDYSKLLYEELSIITRIFNQNRANIEKVSKYLPRLSKPCSVYSKVTFSSSMFKSSEDVVCQFKEASFEVSSVSMYINVKVVNINVIGLIRDIHMFKKIVVKRNLGNNARLIHLLFSVDLLRNIPEPFAMVQVLNMPVGLIFTLAMLHLY